MDAKYVKGMINNPDLQLNATINRWIAGILLFHFEICHITANRHTGSDGLSRCPPADTDPPEDDNFEDWLDDSYSFCITYSMTEPCPLSPRLLLPIQAHMPYPVLLCFHAPRTFFFYHHWPPVTTLPIVLFSHPLLSQIWNQTLPLSPSLQRPLQEKPGFT